MSVTRLAPSPTGALHLGNARTFLINWLLARKNNWRILLRIENIDGPRIKHGADVQAIDDLRWLGIDWDEEPIYQSARLPHYSEAVASLLRSGKAYPCVCSRKESQQAGSAPHAEDGSAVYPGTCRGRFKDIDDARNQTRREPAIRFRVDARPFDFVDQFKGPQHWDDLERQLGDFVIAKADGSPAYHLAVVVDDAAMSVTHVVRGDDLLDSTPRQILLYHALNGAELIPAYTHLPLLIGEDGRRLAKRHGDTRLSHYRSLGVSAGRVRALLARSMGIECENEIAVDAMLKAYSLQRLSADPMIVRQADDAWLRRA